MSFSRAVLLAGLSVATLGASPEDSPIRGTFITTLGSETVAVESYARTRGQLEGDILLRVPGTTRYHYEVIFAADGSAKASEFTIRPLGAPRVDEPRRLRIEVEKDVVRLISVIRGETQIATRPAPRSPIVLFLGGYASSHGLYGSFGMYEQAIARLPVSGRETQTVTTLAADTGKEGTRRFKRPSPTDAAVDFFKMAWTYFTLDETGRILAADASDTTERTITKRVEFMEINRLEKEFVALDKSGKGLGEASPNRETKSTVGGVSVALRYGSPRLRGRGGVQKALIASGAVWRTGANEASTIEIARTMTIGSERIPAGRYSLWTFATTAGVQLIINKEAGQWGTAYKPAQDLVRVPMRVSDLAEPAEDFTIRIDATGAGSELRIEWETFRWSVPIALAPQP